MKEDQKVKAFSNTPIPFFDKNLFTELVVKRFHEFLDIQNQFARNFVWNKLL